jgi:hypothetical protein
MGKELVQHGVEQDLFNGDIFGQIEDQWMQASVELAPELACALRWLELVAEGMDGLQVAVSAGTCERARGTGRDVTGLGL